MLPAICRRTRIFPHDVKLRCLQYPFSPLRITTVGLPLSRCQSTDGTVKQDTLRKDAKPRLNQIQVQQLSDVVYKQVFPAATTDIPEVPPELINLSIHHLKHHELYGKNSDKTPPIGFDLPPLLGENKTLAEHFHWLGVATADPYLRSAKDFADGTIPEPPRGQPPKQEGTITSETTPAVEEELASPQTKSAEHQNQPHIQPAPSVDETGDTPHINPLNKEDEKSYHVAPSAHEDTGVKDEISKAPWQVEWVLDRPGWTKYVRGKAPEPVDSPGDEKMLVFDVETLYKESPFAIMACAASPTAWYSWLSPWLLDLEGFSDKQLIPLGDPTKPRIIVGHNIGYDRARVKEEYAVAQTKNGFIDTMSLHVAVNGMCSRQRPAWLKSRKDKALRTKMGEEVADSDTLLAYIEQASDGEEEELWIGRSSINSLKDVAEFHCDKVIDKGVRDQFGILDRKGVRDMLPTLLDYCAADVTTTFEVYQKVLGGYLEVCPHPVSFGALRHLSSVILPVNQGWEAYINRAEGKYKELSDAVQEKLLKLVEEVVKKDPEEAMKDHWLKQLDWTVEPQRYLKGKSKSKKKKPTAVKAADEEAAADEVREEGALAEGTTKATKTTKKPKKKKTAEGAIENEAVVESSSEMTKSAKSTGKTKKKKKDEEEKEDAIAETHSEGTETVNKSKKKKAGEAEEEVYEGEAVSESPPDVAKTAKSTGKTKKKKREEEDEAEIKDEESVQPASNATRKTKGTSREEAEEEDEVVFGSSPEVPKASKSKKKMKKNEENGNENETTMESCPEVTEKVGKSRKGKAEPEEAILEPPLEAKGKVKKARKKKTEEEAVEEEIEPSSEATQRVKKTKKKKADEEVELAAESASEATAKVKKPRKKKAEEESLAEEIEPPSEVTDKVKKSRKKKADSEEVVEPEATGKVKKTKKKKADPEAIETEPESPSVATKVVKSTKKTKKQKGEEGKALVGTALDLTPAVEQQHVESLEEPVEVEVVIRYARSTTKKKQVEKKEEEEEKEGEKEGTRKEVEEMDEKELKENKADEKKLDENKEEAAPAEGSLKVAGAEDDKPVENPQIQEDGRIPDPRQKLPGMPQWYRDLVKKFQAPPTITVRSRIAAIILGLTWDGYPLVWSDKHGWTYKVPKGEAEEYAKKEKNALKCVFEEDDKPAQLRLDKENVYFKLPHKDGPTARCVNPLSKAYLKLFEEGKLRSDLPLAREALDMNAMCSYWISSRERIMGQLMVYQDEVGKMGIRQSGNFKHSPLIMEAKALGNLDQPPTTEEVASLSHTVKHSQSTMEPEVSEGTTAEHSQTTVGPEASDGTIDYTQTTVEAESVPRRVGFILPQIIPMGTITRRAVEKTWLTASNAKKNRVGSELKSIVTAPDGYHFVGADVDSQELWIASLVGDAQLKLHGGTALGFMTLEGTKSAGTDLHSKTASILGISRNSAKIFNYGRIYGAGVKFATALLKQFNPTISDDDAVKTAEDLYKATKGSKFTRKNSKLVENPFWFGGTESLVFNRLEEFANQERPRTPVLGAGITEALMKQYLSKGGFMTSRINWAIQSSGVDYLHLLVSSMDYLIRKYQLDARLAITVHDEIRYLVRSDHRYRAAMALQVANIWTRAMFSQQMGINDLPQSCAFFSAVDIDIVLRKEVDMDCITPSNPHPIPHGESIDIFQLLDKGEEARLDQEVDETVDKEIENLKIMNPFVAQKPVMQELQETGGDKADQLWALKAQMANTTPAAINLLQSWKAEKNRVSNGNKREDEPVKAAVKRKQSNHDSMDNHQLGEDAWHWYQTEYLPTGSKPSQTISSVVEKPQLPRKTVSTARFV